MMFRRGTFEVTLRPWFADVHVPGEGTYVHAMVVLGGRTHVGPSMRSRTSAVRALLQSLVEPHRHHLVSSIVEEAPVWMLKAHVPSAWRSIAHAYRVDMTEPERLMSVCGLFEVQSSEVSPTSLLPRCGRCEDVLERTPKMELEVP